ncbi:hypothetical protein LSM04_003584 [Trypanosoma melophagium]|uniref:uncharacterized protein n=1 Tax=Trypanosoma melophagium TaxID=715481 RepID=UPI00351A9E4B|nr:hypothetical protein LSM04_003584 [Trypanosoma melophagium]
MSETDDTRIFSSLPPRPPPSSRIRVHNAALYTQLMDAADWSRTIAQEQQKQQQEREKEARASRRSPPPPSKQQSQQQKGLFYGSSNHTRTVLSNNTSELQEEEKFRRYLDTFMEQQQRLLANCAAVSASTTRAARRTAAAVRRNWESTQVRPVQMCIDAQLRDLTSSRKRDAIRHELLQLFLNSRNRAAATHTLHAHLQPEEAVRQSQYMQEMSIRYPTPPLRETAVDAHRREAREVRRLYTQLAREYRKLQRESTTGVLSRRKQLETPLAPPTHFTLTSPSSVNTNINEMSSFRVNDNVVVDGDGGRESGVDFFLGEAAAYHNNNNNNNNNNTAEAGRISSTSYSDPPRVTHTTEAATGEYPTTARIRIGKARRGKEEISAGAAAAVASFLMRDTLDTTMNTNTTDARGSTMPATVEEEVMPVSFLPDMNIAGDEDTLSQWMKQLHAPRPREADLPVKDWSRFKETLHGWVATEDGGVKPSCERRVECAWKLRHSDVMFDHYNYPRGLEGPLHTGKRVV